MERQATDGRWGADSLYFSCTVVRSGDAKKSALVTMVPTQTFPGPADQDEAIAALATSYGGDAITADADGAGYVREGDHPAAAWICHGMTTRVELQGVDVEGRDAVTDARSLLVSTLPWACGSETARVPTTREVGTPVTTSSVAKARAHVGAVTGW